MMTKRIFIVDDHAVVRRGLRQVFEHEPDFRVCGEAEHVAEALLAIPPLAPDLVVSDLTLDGRSGLELVEQLRAYHPELPVLILSMHDEQLYAQRALASGARGYVMKHHSEGDLIRAAREVLAGRTYVSPAIRTFMQVAQHAGEPLSSSPLEVLTNRELEVFLLIGQGYTPRHIAEKLSLSVSTVEVYRERLKEKLNLSSSPLLLRYAVRWCKDNDVS